MTGSMIKSQNLPYCKGCGHDLIAKSTTGALEKLGYNPLDVIAVTDIGCHGIIDKCLNTHTVHGLHGRSVALGAGISFGTADDNQKIVVFVGDGGTTIGLQHIMEAARLNLNVTVVVHNNMLYGMTGGQSSGLTPRGFCTTTSFKGNPFTGYDICKLAHTAGARYVSRVMGVGDITDAMMKAFDQKGFSLVEVMEICPSYGVKLNPRRKLKEIVKESGRELGEWTNDLPAFTDRQGDKTANLLEKTPVIEKRFNHQLQKPLSLVISGSAGEGVQLAANIFSKAAISAGLHATQKGSYPVTVGVGFSTAEINVSPEEVLFHGISVPDMALITSADGLQHNRQRIEKMQGGKLFIDSSLTPPETGAEIIRRDFRSVGARNAAIHSILYLCRETRILEESSVYQIIEQEGKADKMPLDKIRKAMEA